MHNLETKALLLDIEGTTSSIDFVHEVLFPYAQEHLEDFVQTNFKDPKVGTILDEIIETSEQKKIQSPQEKISFCIKQLKAWIKEDKKIKALKDLQGLIWESGYKDGDFHGHLYEDAYKQLKEWHKEGISLYIYSSGSIKAQRLLFAHTKYGDLNNLFTGNFDTSIGNKKEASSYKKILEEINETDIHFLSDNSEELKAAKEACLNVIKLARPQDRIEKDAEYLSIESFDQISFKLSRS